MKIAIDGRWVKQTGIGRYVEETTRGISRLDKENKYSFLLRDKNSYTLAAKNFKFITADYRQFTAGEQFGLLKIINAIKPDLVHFPNFAFPILYRGRFVITIHDLTLFHFKTINSSKNPRVVYEIKHLAMRLTFWLGIRRAQTILVPTEYVKQAILQKYKVKSSKIVVTHEAAEPALKQSRVDLAKLNITKPYILYVGNVYPHKNIERLILSVGKLTQELSEDVQLVMVGKRDVFSSRVEQEVESAKLQDRIIFTGFVSDEELAGLYCSAELFVFPSLSEGFGLPGLEAMTYGLPVASSNATCLPEVYGDAAEYFDPTSIDNMAEVIAKLLKDKKRRTELTKKGYEQVKKFSWEDTARKTLEVYKKALEKN